MGSIEKRRLHQSYKYSPDELKRSVGPKMRACSVEYRIQILEETERSILSIDAWFVIRCWG